MINFHDVKLADYLPINFQTNHIKALGKALLNEKQRLLQKIEIINFNSNISQNAPEELIDLLALENRALYYDESFPLEVKRDIVNKTMSSYMLVGTPGIIKRFLELTSEMVEVKEWFEYNGLPYHFSLYITMPGNAVVTEDVILDIESKIERLKNARSILDVVDIIKQFYAEINISLAAASYVEVNKYIGEMNDIVMVEKGKKTLVDKQARTLMLNGKMLIIKEV